MKRDFRRLAPFAIAGALVGSAYPCDIAPGASTSRPAAHAKVLAPLWAGPAFSGSWYSPERSGEGFTLQVLDNGTALAVWFTYRPAGAGAGQAWIMAQDGVIEGDRIRFDNAFTTRGPRFGAQFDPAQLRIDPWGSFEFRFLDCNRAEFKFAGPQGWGSGERQVVRLTALAELECAGKRELGGGGARSLAGLRSRSGAWYDPAHNGEGWKVEELPDGRAQVYWFTYDESGEQAWTIGVASRSGDRMEIADNLRPVGARFGSAFDPADVRLDSWGSLTLAFDGCDRATASYASRFPAFGSGTLRPVRLTRLAGAACVEGEPGVPSGGTWSAGRPMPKALSEAASANAGDRACLLGGFEGPREFLCYDMATDSWTVMPQVPVGRDHAAAVMLSGGDVLFAGGYPTDGASGQETGGWRFRSAEGRWVPAPALPDVAASGAAILNGYAWFGLHDGGVHQVDLRTLASRKIAGDGRARRDHGQLVAFQGELWSIGGRDTRLADHGRVSIFDPASETWRAGPNLGNARAGFAVAASATTLFVAGGEKLSTQPQRVVSSVEAIAAGAQQWANVAELPVAVHGVGGAVRGNAFFVLGGSTAPGTAFNVPDVQILRWAP